MGVKEEKTDLLTLCHKVPLEVLDLGGFSVCDSAFLYRFWEVGRLTLF